MTIPAKFIREHGILFQGVYHGRRRAKALAQEVEKLTQTVYQMATIGFDDEPSHFFKIQAAGKNVRERGRQ